jgi:hypothetical protein
MAIAVIGLRIIATIVATASIVTSTTVSIVGIISTIVSTIVTTVVTTVVTTIAIIWAIVISVTEAHAPSRVAKSHADTPAKRTPGIPVHIGIVGIIIVPTRIIIGKPPQIGRVVIVSWVAIIVIIDYNRGTRLAILPKRIVLNILLSIECLTALRRIILSQHLCFLL